MGTKTKRKPLKLRKKRAEKEEENPLEVFKARSVVRPSCCTACSKQKVKLIQLKFGTFIPYSIYLCSTCKAYLQGRLRGV